MRNIFTGYTDDKINKDLTKLYESAANDNTPSIIDFREYKSDARVKFDVPGRGAVELEFGNCYYSPHFKGWEDSSGKFNSVWKTSDAPEDIQALIPLALEHPQVKRMKFSDETVKDIRKHNKSLHQDEIDLKYGRPDSDGDRPYRSRSNKTYVPYGDTYVELPD